MPRFDVFASGAGSALLLDVQADILDPLNTRIVVPLMPPDEAPKPARRLNPVFTIGGARVVMVTQFLSAVRISDLGRQVATLEAEQDQVKDALNMLFQGF